MMPLYYKKLVGNKVYLAPISMEDTDTYSEWINNLDVSVKLGNPSGIYSRETEQNCLERLASEGKNFAIVEKQKDRLLGNCGLMSVNLSAGTAEMGIFIGSKSQRHKGYGSEAIELILAFGFKILNLENIMLKAWSFNLPAIQCYEKAGFKCFGVRKKAYHINGKYFDEHYMQILNEDFHSDLFEDVLP